MFTSRPIAELYARGRRHEPKRSNAQRCHRGATSSIPAMTGRHVDPSLRFRLMKRNTLLRTGTARRIGYGRSVVVCAARPGVVLQDRHLGAAVATTRDAIDANGERGEVPMFGGQWPRARDGAEPVARWTH
jgi:hypothetical protein